MDWDRETSAIYDRIVQYAFDDGDEALPFDARLARENGWTSAYTARVILEYRRFVFLAMVAGHPVTPSDQVDQVWHLHLTYTRAYWERFCGEVLEKPFHHGPTRGGPEEARKFRSWYQKTLESYAHFFDHEPPTDLWPKAAIRFGSGGHFQRINLRQNWVIGKPNLDGKTASIIRVVLLAVAIGTLALGMAAAADGGGENDGGWGFVLGIVVFWLFIGAIAYMLSKCSECKRTFSLEPTDVIELGGMQSAWKCKYCGHREWREPDSGGGSGCG